MHNQVWKRQNPKDGLCVYLVRKGLLNSQWYFHYIHTHREWVICQLPSLKTKAKHFLADKNSTAASWLLVLSEHQYQVMKFVLPLLTGGNIYKLIGKIDQWRTTTCFSFSLCSPRRTDCSQHKRTSSEKPFNIKHVMSIKNVTWVFLLNTITADLLKQSWSFSLLEIAGSHEEQ